MSFIQFDGSQVNFVVAFLAGMVTFFASCLLPLVPTYLAYLSGVAIHDRQAAKQRWLIFRAAALFVAGFSLTFIILSLALHHFVFLLGSHRLLLEKIVGGLFVAMGLIMLGVIKHQIVLQERRFDLHGWLENHRWLHAGLTGIGFALGWSPCIGPVLAVILFWSSQQASLWQGVFLLTAYSLGLGAPFLLVGLLFDRLAPYLRKSQRFSHYLNLLAGSVIVITGLLMMANRLTWMSIFLLRWLNLSTLAK